MELDDITTDADGKVLTVTVDAADYDRLLKDAVALRTRVTELESVRTRASAPRMNAPQYITDAEGNRTAVVLDLETYQAMVEALAAVEPEAEWRPEATSAMPAPAPVAR